MHIYSIWLTTSNNSDMVAADLDIDKIASVLPAVKKRAQEMQAEGEALTGHPGLPLEPTPNLVNN